MRFSSLASGSSGNSFYIENNGTAILIDIGISTKQILNRLNHINRDISKVKAIFITHEHSDHIRGLEVFSKRFKIPVYLSRGTLAGIRFKLDDELINIIKDGSEISFKGFYVEAFKKSHDANEPLSFIIKGDKNIAVLTDFGYGCKNIKDAINESDALIIEANHDIDMLINGPYSYSLKQRILSKNGHISNCESALLVAKHSKKTLKHILLAHLSLNNNSPDIALNSYKKILMKNNLNPKVDIACRDKPTELHEI